VPALAVLIHHHYMLVMLVCFLFVFWHTPSVLRRSDT
jgi:hypothetical protein